MLKANISKWMPKKGNPKEKVMFLNVEGIAEMKYKASWLYNQNGKSKLIKLVASFPNPEVAKAVQKAAEEYIKKS